MLAGGVVFIASLAGAAAAHSFAALLVAFVVFFPASGAFVSLTQSGLMDADPARQEQHMARWNLAGSAGAVAGPFLLIAVLAAGGSWRTAFLVLAGCAAASWLGVARNRPLPLPSPVAGSPDDTDGGSAARRILTALGQPGVIRWLALLQLSDLLLDVLTGFLAVYLVDVVHATPAEAALGVGVRLVAALAGDVLLVPLLDRTDGLRVLTASAAAAAAAYPGFLLAPGLWPKLAILAGLSIATACWYPVLQARVYGSLPGQQRRGGDPQQRGRAGGRGRAAGRRVPRRAFRAGMGAGQPRARPGVPADRPAAAVADRSERGRPGAVATAPGGVGPSGSASRSAPDGVGQGAAARRSCSLIRTGTGTAAGH